MGRWATGTMRLKKGSLGELGLVELEKDEDGEVDEYAQAMLEPVLKVLGLLVESGALGSGLVEVQANGYAAKGGKRAAELPTSWLTISVSAIDSATDAPRTWVDRGEPDPDPAGGAIVDGGASSSSVDS